MDYHYPMDRLERTQGGRELGTVFADYGQSEYTDEIEPGMLPGLGNLYFIKNPVHLVRIAANLSRFADLTATEVISTESAVGWTTGLTTVVTRLADLKASGLRYLPGEQEKDSSGRTVRRPVPELMERANAIASLSFRQQFCQDWPAMAAKYPFITKGDV